MKDKSYVINVTEGQYLIGRIICRNGECFYFGEVPEMLDSMKHAISHLPPGWNTMDWPYGIVRFQRMKMDKKIADHFGGTKTSE